jgi:enoyl-CoA hydratase/carnithine racemase
MNEPILFEMQADGLAVLRVNRPAARNALNWAAQEAFAGVVTAVAADPAVRALIITGAGGRAFVSGGDLKELHDHPEAEAGVRLNRGMSQALQQLTQLPIPVLAAVNGDAFGGGCEILTACDLRLATETARFSFAQVKVGLTTGWGGAGRLVRLIGQSRALELLLTARLVTAVEAREIGLIHHLVPAGEDVLAETLAWAQQLAALPRRALAAMKALVYAAGHLPLESVRQLEAERFMELWATPDHLEALAAFREKRSPTFNQPQSSIVNRKS